MMGFVAAAVAELILPAHGLFGGWSGEQLSTFSGVALAAVTCSALLATASKRAVGARLTEVLPPSSGRPLLQPALFRLLNS